MKCQTQENCYYCKDIASYKIFDEWEQKFIPVCESCLIEFGHDDNSIEERTGNWEDTNNIIRNEIYEQ